MNSQPSNQNLLDMMVEMRGEMREVKNHIVRLDSKIETVYRKLDAKIDSIHTNLDAKIDKAVDDITSSFAEFSTDITKRIVVLETSHA